MRSQERLSRNERHRRQAPIKIFALTILSLLLLGLIAFRIISPTRERAITAPEKGSVLPPDIKIKADSVIIECCESFGIGNEPYRDSAAGRQASPAMAGHYFRQAWPDELPFVIFAERLTAMARKHGFQCECLESQKGGWLNCWLKSGGVILGSITLDSDKKAKLSDREIALVFANFGSLKSDDIISLVKCGLPFGYIASPDMYPSAEIRKLLAKRDITPIISMPGRQSEWLTLSQIMGIKKPAKRKTTPYFNEELVDEVFNRQSGAKGFYINVINGIDEPILNAIMARAIHHDIAYLIVNDVLSGVDSLAFARGLTVRCFKGGIGPMSNSLAELKLKLFNRILYPYTKGHWFVGIIDISKIDFESLMQLRSTLDALGVKIRPVMKLTESVAHL